MEKRRGANWEQSEKDLLLNLVLEQLEIIENPKIDTNTNMRKREAWNAVHILFNEVSKHNRTLEQIQNQWRKTKSLAKTRNSAVSEINIEDSPKIDVTVQKESITTDDEFLNTEDDTRIKQRIKPINIKRKRNRQCESESENAKRLQLLELSIKQKVLEMKCLEENHNIKKTRAEMLAMQEKEEHTLRVEKLKLEIEKLRTRGFFTSSSPNPNEI